MREFSVVHRRAAVLHLPFPLCFPLSPGQSQQTQSHAQCEGERQKEESGLERHGEDTDMQQPEWGHWKVGKWEIMGTGRKDTGMGIFNVVEAMGAWRHWSRLLLFILLGYKMNSNEK